MAYGQIPNPFIEDLVARTDLANLIGERVQLKKAGGNHKGCCPFHDEKTPSFFVYNQADPAHYHCFGCGAHGDAIDFLQNIEHLSFADAVESLAARYGLEVPRDQSAQQAHDQLKPLLEAATQAQENFRRALTEHPDADIAVQYLKKRGISDEMTSLFGLGFAPANRQFLTRPAAPQRLRAYQDLRLVIDKDGSKFDLFQNRLMFPIRNTRGRVVAFAGRTLGNDRSKYINSPESAIFHKSQHLYGLWEARQRSKKLEQLIVVEGYLDVISLSQHGITNAVAAMGTATNEENLSHLLATCGNIVFCFDGDQAGVAAADKALRNILSLVQDGQKISFLLLPEGEDPDSLIRKEGTNAFQTRIENALPLSEYLFESAGRDLNLQLPEDKGVLSSRSRELFAPVNAKILKEGLYQRLRELTRAPRWSKASHFGQHKPLSQPVPVPNRTVARVCLGLYQQPDWAKEVQDHLNFEITDKDESALPIFLHWILSSGVQTSREILYALAVDSGLRSQFGNLFQELQHIFDEKDNFREAQAMLNVLRSKYLRKNFEQVEKEMLANPKDAGVQEKYRTITKQLNAIQEKSSQQDMA